MRVGGTSREEEEVGEGVGGGGSAVGYRVGGRV